VSRGPLGLKGSKGLRASQELRVQLVHRVNRDRLESLVQLAPPVLKEIRAVLESPVQRVRRVVQESRE
jgi:hypothetical protein